MEAFDSIYVINLRTRPDRRREMAQELARLGLSFDRPRVHLHEAAQFADRGSFPLVGARGCFHSHLDILERVAETEGHVLIFEDDCDFTSHIGGKIVRALKALAGRNWSFFYGGYESVTAPDGIEPLFLVPADEWILGTHFVAFNKAIIPDLIAFLKAGLQQQNANPESGFKGIDGAYHHYRAANPQLETYLASPKLGYQRPSRTNISPAALDNYPMMGATLAILRRVKRSVVKRLHMY